MIALVDMLMVLQDISVSYSGVRALTNVSASFGERDWVLCTGPSGSGKSTLASLLAGTLPANASTTGRLEGRPARVVKIWQEVSSTFSPYRKVGDQVKDVLRVFGQDARLAEDLFAAVGIAGRMEAYVSQLSSGQLQRVAIARALALKPDLLIADESTASLDPATEVEILSLLASLQDRSPFSILWCTHRPHAAMPWANQHWRIENGSLRVLPELGSNPEISTNWTLSADSTFADEPRALLEAKGIEKSYSKTILRDVSMRLRERRTVALVGPSGSGKSTLARILAGQEKPDCGFVDRTVPAQLILPDPFRALNPHWNVGQAVAEALAILGCPK